MIDAVAPFGKVTKAEFDLNGLRNYEHAAKLQYELMNIEEVIRAAVSFSKKSMSLAYVKPNTTTQEILRRIKPVRATLKSKETIEYASLVARGNHE